MTAPESSELQQLLETASRAETESELERLFRLSIDLLCIADYNGYFTRVNPAWEHVLGWRMEEMIAQPYADFVHPDDRAATAAESAKLAQGGEVISFENRYLCRDGTYKWLHWNAAPGRDRIFAAARDVTARRSAERRLAAAHAVTSVLAEAPTLDAATPRILRAVCESLDWEAGAIWRAFAR